MKLLKQEWTQPNHLKFNGLWKDEDILFEAIYHQPDNKPYENNGVLIKRAAVPFLVYKGEIYFGGVGHIHDEMFCNLYPKKINDSSIDVVYDKKGKVSCVDFRNTKVFAQQGRCFVFQIEKDRICIITTWHDNATEDLFEKIKRKIKAGYYYYIHYDNLQKV